MTTDFSTIQTTVPAADDAGMARSRKVSERLDDLRTHGRHGYPLTSTVPAPGIEYVTIMGTLAKEIHE